MCRIESLCCAEHTGFFMESRFLVVKKQIGDGDKYLKLYFKIGRKQVDCMFVAGLMDMGVQAVIKK